MLNKDVEIALIKKLAEEEENVHHAWVALRIAQEESDIANLKFKEIHGAAREYLGKSPFSKGVRGWPEPLPSFHGRYRFYGRHELEAIQDVLLEADKPMTLENINEELLAGAQGYDNLGNLGESLKYIPGLAVTASGYYIDHQE